MLVFVSSLLRTARFVSIFEGSALAAFVVLPVFFDSLGHGLTSRLQPMRFSSTEIFQDVLHAIPASQVYVCCFRAHSMKENFFVALLRQACYLDRIRIGRESPDYPSANCSLIGIVRAPRRRNRALIIRIAIAGVSIEPGA